MLFKMAEMTKAHKVDLTVSVYLNDPTESDIHQLVSQHSTFMVSD